MEQQKQKDKMTSKMFLIKKKIKADALHSNDDICTVLSVNIQCIYIFHIFGSLTRRFLEQTEHQTPIMERSPSTHRAVTTLLLFTKHSKLYLYLLLFLCLLLLKNPTPDIFLLCELNLYSVFITTLFSLKDKGNFSLKGKKQEVICVVMVGHLKLCSLHGEK